MQEFVNKQLGVGNSGGSKLGVGNPESDMTFGEWDTSVTVITATTLAGNIAGGMYAYHAKGGFWWTLLGIIVGGAAGNVTGRLVTLPLRH